MTAGISSTSSTSAAPATGTAGAGFDAELSKCEGELSDWVHCPSGKTPEGKAKIAEITARIDNIKARIQKREETAGHSQAAGQTDASSAHGRVAVSAPGDVQKSSLDTAATIGAVPVTQSPRLDGLGGFIDVYA